MQHMDSNKEAPQLGQLFFDIDQLRAKKSKAKVDILRKTTVTREHYPMYAIPVPVFLELPRFLPHQHMLKAGQLVRVTPVHTGKIIFVSHEWAGYEEPDPKGDQLKCLQTVLSRLLAGMEDGVESSWLQQLVFKTNVRIRAKYWMKHLAHMFIWVDYCSMPQPRAGPMPPESEIVLFCKGSEGIRRKATEGLAVEEQLMESSGIATRRTDSSDHRFGSNELSDALTKAVESIPSYVERSALMLVLVPTTQHHNRIGDVCDFRSWRGRGWCRMEFLCALMARNKLRLMIVQGAAATPTLSYPGDAMTLAPGEGAFTCCARNHDLGGGPNTYSCDKNKVRCVLDVMIDAKVESLFVRGKIVEARYFAAVKLHFMRGLPDPHSLDGRGGNDSKGEGLAALKLRLRWRGDEEECAETKRTGLGIVFWAAAADDTVALREALEPLSKEERRDAARRGVTQDWPSLSMKKGTNPLMIAMQISRWDVVEMLLDQCDADPNSFLANGQDALMCAATSGQVNNIMEWMRRFPEWNLEQKGAVAGETALVHAVQFGANKLPTVEALLAAGANPAHILDSGGTILGQAAQNPDANDALMRRLLQIPVVAETVDRKQASRSLLWRAIWGGSRLAVRLGSKNACFGFFARLKKGTALHLAVELKNVEVVRALAEVADKKACTSQGKTPLELAYEVFGARDQTPTEFIAALQSQ